MLKESIYNVYKATENGYLLYNTLYGGMIRIDSEEYDGIKALSSSVLRENWAVLVQNGFLMEETIDERRVFDKLRFQLENLTDKRDCHYVIAVTTACNANCNYCYEKGVSTIEMDRELADQVIQFVKENALQNSHVYITWFGGEPLLNTGAISYISDELRKSDVVFSSSIISNGLLFHENLIQYAKDDWNLSHVQISMDGLEERYHAIKNYNNGGKNPFQTVICNIKTLIDNEIAVSVRLNICRNNAKEMIGFVRYLAKLIPFSQYLTIYPAFIAGGSKEDDLLDKEKVEVVYRLLQEMPFFAFTALESTIYASPEITACMRETNNSILIDADGGVCRCEHDVGREKKESIDAGIRIQDYALDYRVIEQCANCQFYPRCLGGCMADRLSGNAFCSINKYLIEAIMQMRGE